MTSLGVLPTGRSCLRQVVRCRQRQLVGVAQRRQRRGPRLCQERDGGVGVPESIVAPSQITSRPQAVGMRRAQLLAACRVDVLVQCRRLGDEAALVQYQRQIMRRAELLVRPRQRLLRPPRSSLRGVKVSHGKLDEGQI